MNGFDRNRDGKGTGEWADSTYNICLGCEHGCRYCYAKAYRCRFDKEMKLPGQWEKQSLNPQRHRLGSEIGRRGVVMFPSTHDIVPRFLDECIVAIKNLLQKNQVLIVSKPHQVVVARLCEELKQRKSEVLFRFTIGSLSDSLCCFWEPGAPLPGERLRALQHAHKLGFATSVSIEPMLDSVEQTLRLVDTVEPYVTGSVWIGKMQRIPLKDNAHVPGFRKARETIRTQQTDAEIVRLVELLNDHPKVRWKDSIKKVMDAQEGLNHKPSP